MPERYKLGVMDLYPLAIMGTSIEDSPTMILTLDEPIDGKRLHRALCEAAEMFPLFKTRIVFDKGYYLERNDNPILIFNEDDHDRAFTWKTGTNDYPWKLSYYDNQIIIRWCHAVTDGRGAEEFLKAILYLYYGSSISVEPTLELGLEPFADKKEKGLPQKKQPKGFGKGAIKLKKSGRESQVHVLKCKTADVLKLAKRSDASPATVIPPLFSMALRKCMKKKKNVSFSIVIDARGPLGHKTMHNCIFTKAITYIDRFDEMSFELVSTIYRAILNLACEPENVVVAVTDYVSLISHLVGSSSEAFIRFCGKLCALFMKGSDSDATFSYHGKVDFGEEVNKHIRSYKTFSWTDFDYCNITAADLNGEFCLIINEAYDDERVVPGFISLAKEFGIEMTETESFRYVRADK